MSTKKTRRELIAGAGVAAGAVAATTLVGCSGKDEAKAPVATGPAWDAETDVVVVGSGAAGCTAAVTAMLNGAKVMVLEKMPLTGGTTAKSGGVLWIPNNPLLRERGQVDERADCLKYMARYSYPQVYDANSSTLGLDEARYRLLEAIYDNGSAMVETVHGAGAAKLREFRMWAVDKPAPDYADHLPENKLPSGRCLEPAEGWGANGGRSLVDQLETWLNGKGVTVQTEHRVTGVIKEGGRAVGVEVEAGGRTLRIKANRGVVFGSGGYAQNAELCAKHQPGLVGACALPGSTGDFIPIAQATGAMMGPLQTAWRSQVVFEEAVQNRALGVGAFVLPGDSMVVVNKYGQRVVNEKRCYNDRTRVHFTYDPAKEEYPNHLLFMIFDERSIDAFGGSFPFPQDKAESPYLIEAPTFSELAAAIDARLETLSAHSGGVRLDASFNDNFATTLANFNRYAKAGADPEFDRGKYAYDNEWHLVFSARREGTEQPENALPTRTMYPFADKGPYYAFILAAGALDTSGGPQINEQAQVLAADGAPIPGLYGAGNCIASPSFTAYYAAGGTIGLAMTFGYIAGKNAAAVGTA